MYFDNKTSSFFKTKSVYVRSEQNHNKMFKLLSQQNKIIFSIKCPLGCVFVRSTRMEQNTIKKHYFYVTCVHLDNLTDDGWVYVCTKVLSPVCLHTCTYIALFQSTQFFFICSSDNFTCTYIQHCVSLYTGFSCFHTNVMLSCNIIHTVYIYTVYICVTTTDTETCSKSVNSYAMDTSKIGSVVS